MTTILRSSRYIRCLNVFTRRIISHDSSAIANKKRFELQLAQCAHSYLTKSYATKPAIQQQGNAQSFDHIFQELDNKIQRYGRIFSIEVEEVLSKIQEIGYISSLDALLLIRCCGNLVCDTPQGERTKLANKIWGTLETLKVPLDVQHYNAMLRVYLDNDHEFSPTAFLATMNKNGVEPNKLTYRRLILYHCNRGKIDGATEILESMNQKGIPLDEAIFGALITGHSEAGDLESAKNVVNVMKEAGIEPSSTTYKSLIKAYGKRGDMAAIKQTLDECGKRNMFFTDNDYFELIQTLVKNEHTGKVEEILALMPKGPNYNVDAVQAILKILDMENVETALQILKTFKKIKRVEKDMSVDYESGSFLIRKLVNAKFPPEVVIEACETMQRDGSNTQAFSIALQRSLAINDVDMSIALMEGWKRNGGETRQHYFWPMLAYYGGVNNYEGILDIVKIMSNKFNITPNVETVRDFILPFTLGKWDDILSSLQEYNIPYEVLVTGIALRMLYDGKPRKTAGFMLAYTAKYDPQKFYRILAESIIETSDGQAFAVILRILTESENKNSTPIDVVNCAVDTLLTLLPKEKYDVIQKVVDNMIKVGLSMSPEIGQKLREYCDAKSDSEMDAKIDKLTSGTLTPTPLADLTELASRADFNSVHNLSERQSTFVVKRRELREVLEKHDVEGLKKVTEQLEACNFSFTPALYAQISDVFCSAGDLEMTEKWRNKSKDANADIVFDIQKVTDFAALLIKSGRLDDAITSVRDSARTTLPQNFSPGLKRMIKRVLDAMAETGEVEKTNELFKAFLEGNFIEIDNFVLGSLVKVHLNRNDYAGAMKVFEHACTKYRCTPLKNELSKVFINAEDADSLQKLTDLSTLIHGENNSLIDLVLSFVECGRFRQARKILETPGLQLRDRKLKTIVDRYVMEDKASIFEQFFDLTKGLPFIDRQELYEILMAAFDRKNMWQKGLNLWMTMQEEDVQPSRQFLKSLRMLLVRNQQPVPFAYDSSVMAEHLDIDSTDDGFKELYKNIEENDLKKARASLKYIASDHPEYSRAVSVLMMAYISKENNVDAALALAEELILIHRRAPISRALKATWRALLDSGKTDKLRSHGKIIPMTTLKNLHFGRYLAQADLQDYGLEKFLQNLEEKIANATGPIIETVKDSIPFACLMDTLKKHPEFVDKFVKIAENLYEKQFYSPINIVWCHYFEQNKPEADEIFNKYLADADHIVFAHLVNISRRENNVDLAERLYNKFKDSKVINDKSKFFLVNTIVELYLTNGRVEEALKIYENMTQSVRDAWARTFPIDHRRFLDIVRSSGKSLPSDSDRSS
ncbi:leucine-rich PPR motif-containing protein, mitochondrial [Venturia canescens]|uniref:leucine-rich PPR motif-containing protein, mitochondrial n=1 Tax=Venturia canescens TaxID=32260 RepID=UPI001C9CCE2F|nr:leucine-rich PPR motif-containing protein, mitochondrial [Venturia canescens]